MKKPEELFFQNEKGLNKFELTTRHIFECVDKLYEDDKEWEKFYGKLSREYKRKLSRFGHFYYFICQPYQDYRGDIKEESREELVLVGITSLIEAMMEIEGCKHKDFFEWYESTYKKEKLTAKNYKEIKEEYLEKHGATRKVKRYFKKYIIGKSDKELLLKSILKYNEKKKIFCNFDDFGKIAEFLYQTRSDFVHKAKMRYLCHPSARVSLLEIGGKPYMVKIHIKEFMRIFEKSFVYYWKQKVPKNDKRF